MSSTLYDHRKTQALSVERLTKMQNELQYINIRIEFSNCIPPVTNTTKMQNAMHGQFMVSSPLSFHLNLVERTTNIVSVEKPLYTKHKYSSQKLPT